MLGAVAGDIMGSAYEFTEQKRYDFEMLPQGSRFTDDTVMTIAVAHWLAHYDEEGLTDKQLITTMQEFGRKYPFAGYGSSFNSWLWSEYPQPYNSWGNGELQCVSVRSDSMLKLLMKRWSWQNGPQRFRTIIPKESRARKRWHRLYGWQNTAIQKKKSETI